jgi:hypothetical protein
MRVLYHFGNNYWMMSLKIYRISCIKFINLVEDRTG